MRDKATLRCGRKGDDMDSWEFWGRNVLSDDDVIVEEETAIVLSTLLKHNRLHESVCIQAGVLPLQQLRGTQDIPALDLSGKMLTSPDAIVIGSISQSLSTGTIWPLRRARIGFLLR